MKKFKFTRDAIKLIEKSIIISEEGKTISFNESIILENCEQGEESIIISVFSSALENKKYFKEIK